jgi:hypothetical protein
MEGNFEGIEIDGKWNERSPGLEIINDWWFDMIGIFICIRLFSQLDALCPL